LDYIITLCLMLDRKAEEAYHELARFAKDPQLADFWRSMADEEAGHVFYWKRLLEFARKNTLPPVFSDTEKIRLELEHIVLQVDNLLVRARHYPNVTNSFLLAFRMEFYMLHPAFRTLFRVLKTIRNEKTPLDMYEKHISRLVDAVGKFGYGSPELELIGQSMSRFWTENRELTEMSDIDELTGIYNRRGFSNNIRIVANLAQRNSFQVGMMMLDIDNFKTINDTYGHKMGDDVIKGIANVLRNTLRTSDILGRYGGEEFVVFLPHVHHENLNRLAEVLRKNINEGPDFAVGVTVSIGVAMGVFSVICVQCFHKCLFSHELFYHSDKLG
jgi:diguanylate cyclase (GGDEF)-like protein